jgi:hypothetical protein
MSRNATVAASTLGVQKMVIAREALARCVTAAARPPCMADFRFTDEQGTLRETVRRWATAHQPGFDQEPTGALLRDLGSLGVLGLGRGAAGGGAVDLYVAMAELGRVACPGPLVAAVVASALVDDERRPAIEEGRLRCSLLVGDLVPDLQEADLFVALDDDGAWEVRLCEVTGTIGTALGDVWSRGTIERVGDLGGSSTARVLRDVATAAYLIGAARHQLDAAGRYAEVRMQFGQRLIDFQGVAFPISKAVVDVLQAESMTMVAAAEQDRDERPLAEPGVATAALAARVAAEWAALQATYVAHQAMGAIGYTVEGPLAGHTLSIRQAALSVPLSDGDRHRLDVLAGLAEAGV